ncbi:MAG: 2-phospho-L-lactate guanylyltransferase [Promethearchaeota archaeon]|nr:MAG: 2-phospho-L-lactate guanylyltransferase [Candidatus Lokiarchaeota archaeon]
MSILLIPIAPLSRTKSRLRDCFSKTQLKELTICMFKDLGNTLSYVDCFDEIIVYCNDEEILTLADKFNLIGMKEELTTPRKSFDEVISDLNVIALEQFNAKTTVFTFLDTILISPKNFNEIAHLIEDNQLIVCPAIHSAGISVIGRKPPNIIPTYFSDPTTPSFVAQMRNAKKHGLTKIKVYDSFRAGFDIDVKQDLLLAYEYLKILDLTETFTYRFLKDNLTLSIQKSNTQNNRIFQFREK